MHRATACASRHFECRTGDGKNLQVHQVRCTSRFFHNPTSFDLQIAESHRESPSVDALHAIAIPNVWKSCSSHLLVHQDAQLIPMDLDTPDYELNGDKLPAISASASKDAEGKIHISLVNIDAHKENTVSIDLSELDIKDFSAEILASEKLQDHNSFEDPKHIMPEVFKDFKFKKGVLEVTLPAFSVVVLEGK